MSAGYIYLTNARLIDGSGDHPPAEPQALLVEGERIVATVMAIVAVTGLGLRCSGDRRQGDCGREKSVLREFHHDVVPRPCGIHGPVLAVRATGYGRNLGGGA